MLHYGQVVQLNDGLVGEGGGTCVPCYQYKEVMYRGKDKFFTAAFDCDW